MSMTVHLATRSAPAAAWAFQARDAEGTSIRVAEASDDASLAAPAVLRRVFELVQGLGANAEIVVHDEQLLAQYRSRVERWATERTPFPGPADRGGWGEVRRLEAEDGFRFRLRPAIDAERPEAERLSAIMDFAAAGAPYEARTSRGVEWDDLAGRVRDGLGR